MEESKPPIEEHNEIWPQRLLRENKSTRINDYVVTLDKQKIQEEKNSDEWITTMEDEFKSKRYDKV